MKPQKDGPPPRGNAGRPESEPLQIPATTIRHTPERVYLVAPLTAFDSDRHERAYAEVRRRFPGSEVKASVAFQDVREWHAWWRSLLPTLAHVVFIANDDGTIGAGVLAEIFDARTLRIPVLYLDPLGDFHRLDRLAFRFTGTRDACRIAYVIGAANR